MLILVAGATGNLGQWLIESITSRGHQARLLARNLSKLNADRLSLAESTVASHTYYDIAALDRACAGVDAVICAYSGLPELQLEAQLLLLRAAERAGVKRFVASSWSYDWSELPLGVQDSYDGFISFRNHVEKSSSIRPIYIFSGVFAEVLFSVPGHGDFSPKNHGVWDPDAKSMEIWGSGNEPWHWTTERDGAEFAAEIVTRDSAADGGFWSVCSGTNSLREIASVYEEVRQTKVKMQERGTVEELRAVAFAERAKGSVRNFWSYIGWFYQLYTIDGTWTLKHLDNDKLNVQTTPLRQFLADNPSI